MRREAASFAPFLINNIKGINLNCLGEGGGEEVEEEEISTCHATLHFSLSLSSPMFEGSYFMLSHSGSTRNSTSILQVFVMINVAIFSKPDKSHFTRGKT
jgi:hypothetical protein